MPVRIICEWTFFATDKKSNEKIIDKTSRYQMEAPKSSSRLNEHGPRDSSKLSLF